MLLIKNAIIVDAASPLNGKKRDLLIEKGQIKKIGTRLSNEKAKVVSVKDLHISLGWFDIGVQSGEPGYEHREDIETLTNAAAAGGYTGLACFPNTIPVVQAKADILFLKNQSSLVDLYPIGVVSQDCKGKDLAELYDMSNAGAIAFSDGKKAIQSSGLMKRSLEYVKGIDGLIINHPDDEELAEGGQIHEGSVSTSLGMKGLSTMAEEMMLKRDLDLLAYTESRLHVHNISSVGAVALIKAAKKKGLNVTASVAAVNLVYDHHVLESFNTNFKVKPPLRTQKDVKALIKGLKEGTIDSISTNHVPLEDEAKKLEFLYASFGMIGLETTFALLNTFLAKQLPLELIIERLVYHSRNIVRLPVPKIEEGAVANLTLFLPNLKWTVTKKDIFSKSKNTPFIGQQMKGKVLGVVNGKLEMVNGEW